MEYKNRDEQKGLNAWSGIFLPLVFLIAVITGIALGTFYFIGMQHYPVLFPVIPLFYLLDGVALCAVVAASPKKGGGISLKTVATLRFSRLFACIVLLLAGTLSDREHLVSYVVVFVVYYLAYLFFETKVMVDLNRRKNKTIK